MEFTEKPDKATAQHFIDAKKYYWNSGIFVWSATAVLEGFKAHSPVLYDLFNKGFDHLNTDAEAAFVSQKLSASRKHLY